MLSKGIYIGASASSIETNPGEPLDPGRKDARLGRKRIEGFQFLGNRRHQHFLPLEGFLQFLVGVF
jgi:hypothetical protein